FYTRSLNWALDRPLAIIGVAVAVFLTTFPLHRMVGRTVVPTEDMGEWTIHLDTPEGTSLEGSSDVAMMLVRELSGIEGVAQLQPTITERNTHIHLIAQALPLDERNSTQEQMV